MKIEIEDSEIENEVKNSMKEVIKEVILEKITVLDIFDETIIKSLKPTIKQVCNSKETMNKINELIVNEMDDRYIIDDDVFTIIQDHAKKVIKESLE